MASVSGLERGTSSLSRIESVLGEDAELLRHQCRTIPRDMLHLPGPDFVDRIVALSDRTPRVLGSLQALFASGRLAGTGYVSILPVDQGIEHSAGASFAPNIDYFDPENIIKLAIEGGCNAVASTLGVLGSVARRYAHKIPFILKLNHNEFISYPNSYDQIRFGSVKQAFDLGAAGVGATIYFGSPESKRQLQEIAEMFQQARDDSSDWTTGNKKVKAHQARLAHDPSHDLKDPNNKTQPPASYVSELTADSPKKAEVKESKTEANSDPYGYDKKLNNASTIELPPLSEERKKNGYVI